jgi:uncharacterized protein DUF6544
MIITERFAPALLDGLDEPVRRYFTHALADGARLSRGVRAQLSGDIRMGVWLSFTSVWEGDGRSFSWEATAGPGPLLRVHDRFADGVGFMDIRVRPPFERLPALKLLHVENDDTARSGAGRAALEALWTPASLLPSRGVAWRADSDEVIVASWDIPPERPELHITIDGDGAVRSWRSERWRDSKTGYQPFGADVLAERRFGDLTVPSRLTAGWGHGTDGWAPFFRCEATTLELVTGERRSSGARRRRSSSSTDRIAT